MSNFSLTLFVDLDNDSLLSVGDGILSIVNFSDSITSGDSLLSSIEITDFQWSAVTLGAIVSLDGDENRSNNSAFRDISFSFESQILVINEIMYNSNISYLKP